MKMLSICSILFLALLTNATNFTSIRIYSNLAEVIRHVETLPLEFTSDEWNNIRSDSFTLFSENINITLETITEQVKSLNGSTVYIRSPLSSEHTGIKLIKAIIVDDTRNLVKIQDESIASNKPLYYTVPPNQYYYVEEPEKSKYLLNFTYTNRSDAKVFLTYLQSNIHWETQYRLDLNDNETDLTALANIRNDGKLPISVEECELIGGDINLQTQITPIRHARFDQKTASFAAEANFMMSKPVDLSTPPSVGQGIELVGLYVFPIKKPFTIQGKTNYLLSMYHPEITIERYGLISKMFSPQTTKGKAQRSYRLRSDRYLSQGSCIIREQNRIVGQTDLPNLAAKDKYEFSIGEDANIIYKENVTLVSSTSFNETQAGVKITTTQSLTPVVITLRTRNIYNVEVEIKNFKNKSINVEYEQHGFIGYRSLKIVKTNKHRFIQDGLTIKSNMTLKANSEERFPYTIELID